LTKRLPCQLAVANGPPNAPRQSRPDDDRAFSYRAGPHSTSDDPARYRPADEARQWPLGDPIERLRDHLVSLGEWSEEQHRAAQEEAVERRATGREAEKVGVLSTEAPQKRAEMFEDVYKDVPWHLAQQRDEGA
jgi:2-oxoisovalerate dehydrogenase E1 component alpha subunit